MRFWNTELTVNIQQTWNIQQFVKSALWKQYSDKSGQLFPSLPSHQQQRVGQWAEQSCNSCMANLCLDKHMLELCSPWWCWLMHIFRFPVPLQSFCTSLVPSFSYLWKAYFSHCSWLYVMSSFISFLTILIVYCSQFVLSLLIPSKMKERRAKFSYLLQTTPFPV